jgi:hypothetical protein
MRRIPLTALFVTVLVCCTGDSGEPTVEIVRGGVERENGSEGRVPVCLQTGPFVEDGAIPLDPAEPGDADKVRNIRAGVREGCERLVIDFFAGESAASSVGEVRAEVLRELGVVRVELLDVETVDPRATDRRLEGSLGRAVYAVWSPEGRWVFVDVHLRAAAEAAVSVLEDPARVVIDLRPGGSAIQPARASADRVVVLTPRPGPATWPIEVSGYSRTFEANVVFRLEQDGEQIEETFTTATAWVDAWGYFSTTIEEGPAGAVRLHVGEHSAKDGRWEGVAIDLDMGRGGER